MGNSERSIIDFLEVYPASEFLLYHVRVDLWVGWWEIKNNPKIFTPSKTMAWLSIPTPFLGYAILLFSLSADFCIHYPNTSRNAKPCWKTYLIRRFWRIYPAYFAALVVTACISFLCLTVWGIKPGILVESSVSRLLSQNYPPENGQFLDQPFFCGPFLVESEFPHSFILLFFSLWQKQNL